MADEVFIPQSNRFSVERDAEKLEYRYDELKRACLNKKSQPGRNLNTFSECGELVQVKVDKLDLKNAQLKGLFVKDSNLGESDFESADLSGAIFVNSDIRGSRFQNAVLFDTQFKLADSLAPAQLDSFLNARINPSTVFPFRKNDVRKYHLQNLLNASLRLESFEKLPVGVNALSVEFGKGVQEASRLLLENDLAQIMSLDFGVLTSNAGKNSRNMFEQAFGVEPDGPTQFLQKRLRRVSEERNSVHTMVAANYSIQVFMNQISQLFLGKTFSAYESALKTLTEYKQISETEASRWLKFHAKTWEIFPNDYLKVFAQDGFEVEKLEIGAPPTQWVTLGPLYFSTQLSSLERMGTLFHEARHADCSVREGSLNVHQWIQNYWDSNKVLSNELSRIQKILPSLQKNTVKQNEILKKLSQVKSDLGIQLESLQKFSEDFNSNLECGHKHSPCSASHPDQVLRGQLGACDNHNWGAYAVGASFFQGVAVNCINCSETEKQIALIASFDSLNRISDLPAQKADLDFRIESEALMTPFQGLSP